MTALSDILALVEGNDFSIDGVVITAADVAKLKAVPWADFTAALEARLSSVDKDALAVEDVVAVAGDFGFAAAPIVIVAIKIGVLAYDNSTQGRPGSQTPIISGKKGSDPWQS